MAMAKRSQTDCRRDPCSDQAPGAPRQSDIMLEIRRPKRTIQPEASLTRARWWPFFLRPKHYHLLRRWRWPWESGAFQPLDNIRQSAPLRAVRGHMTKFRR